MSTLKSLIYLSLLFVYLVLLQNRFGSLPPIGDFFNPITGFWQNSESKTLDKYKTLFIKGITDSVIIQFDELRIPHIFAHNEYDLYLAQGYITANDRLWQMDIQTRTAAGRLSEVIGKKGVEIDRYHRRIGMVYAAENTLKKMYRDSKTKMALEAYSAGVNQYIHQLKRRDYPIEFKLLDYSPEDFKPINSVFFLKLMSETLAGSSHDFAVTNVLNRFGIKVIDELFPSFPFKSDPIIPTGTKWGFKPKQTNGKNYSTIKTIGSRRSDANVQPDGIGSNNWAISGNKTTSGYPILANDPHLKLTLPSIWYAIQLCCPNANVCGVSFPGVPNVVIGFNKHIAWGVTNVNADVLDWYQITYKDNKKNFYRYNNKWEKVKKRIEILHIRNEQDIREEVNYTRFGPVVYEDITLKPKTAKFQYIPVGCALKWIAHVGENELKTFYLLNRAYNYHDYRSALVYYAAPAQNFIFASNDNDIAITVNGKFPLKSQDQGKFILDGSDPENDWQGWVPNEQNPSIKNPVSGYLFSANEAPTDRTYPYYINWQFAADDRAKRIAQLLGNLKNATVNDMQHIQNDCHSELADDVLSTMLNLINRDQLSSDDIKAVNTLKNWDKYYGSQSIGATVFDSWWNIFYHDLWKEVLGSDNVFFQTPSQDQTVKLLIRSPNASWFDKSEKKGKQGLQFRLTMAFKEAVASLTKKAGRNQDNWHWGEIKKTHIDHLGKINGFGSGNLPIGGGTNIVNAVTDVNGPSWRMVVQLGKKVKGFGIFPGGESGNPGSYYYDNMLSAWKKGELKELLFLQQSNTSKHTISTTILKN